MKNNEAEKLSEKVKVITIHQTQKNVDVYVIERRIKYDPEKKSNKILASKLIAKIPKDEKDLVPTRPKRRSKKTKKSVSDSCNQIGMIDIISYIGEDSGIGYIRFNE